MIINLTHFVIINYGAYNQVYIEPFCGIPAGGRTAKQYSTGAALYKVSHVKIYSI
jgi:hypothetical protein